MKRFEELLRGKNILIKLFFFILFVFFSMIGFIGFLITSVSYIFLAIGYLLMFEKNESIDKFNEIVYEFKRKFNNN